MASAHDKPQPLWFTRELFTDYWTALISRVRQDETCDQVYSGTLPHPLIRLQKQNQKQILEYKCTLVPEAVLQHNPIEPAEKLVRDVKNAAALRQVDPPLAALWKEFKEFWPKFKTAQRKIYAIAVATLKIGISMHYARTVPFGAGTRLLSVIYSDNRRNTTRSLFALFASLFLLKAKPNETFDGFKLRFDLITARLQNWNPPIVLPDTLLLYFVLRGLPDSPYGPTKHIILATPKLTLVRGLQLLKDVGEGDSGLITATLGSGEQTPLSATTEGTLQSPSNSNNILALRPQLPNQQPQLPKKDRRTALCKQYGPCEHHGKQSLHATCECKDPQLLKRKKRKERLAMRKTQNSQVNAVTPSPAAAPAQPMANPTAMQFPYMPTVPYHPYMFPSGMPHPAAPQHFMQPMSAHSVPHQTPNADFNQCLVIRVEADNQIELHVSDEGDYDADSEDDDSDGYEDAYASTSDLQAKAADVPVPHGAYELYNQTQSEYQDEIQQLLDDMPKSDTEEEFPLSFYVSPRNNHATDSCPSLIGDSSTSLTSSSSSDSEGPPDLIDPSQTSSPSESDSVHPPASESDSEDPPSLVTASDSSSETAESSSDSKDPPGLDDASDSSDSEDPPGLVDASDSSDTAESSSESEEPPELLDASASSSYNFSDKDTSYAQEDDAPGPLHGHQPVFQQPFCIYRKIKRFRFTHQRQIS